MFARLRRPGIVLLALGSLLLTNCGGGGSSSSTPPAPPSFTIGLGSPNVTVPPGYSATVNVSLRPVNGFSGAVTVAITGLPDGVTSTPASPFQLPATGQKVTLTATSSTVHGDYPISFSATSSTLSSAANLTLQVEALQAFFLTLHSQELTVHQGSSGSISFGILNNGGPLGYALNLAVTGLPNGATGSFTKNPIAPTEDGTLTITVASSAPASMNNPVTITATRSLDSAQDSATFLLSAIPPPGHLPVNRSDFIRTDGNIVAAVYDPEHRLVFASNPAWNRVEVISPVTKRIVKSIPVPYPTELDLSLDGKQVLAGSATQQIFFIDTQSLQVVRRALPPPPQYGGLPLQQGVGAWKPLALSDGNVLILYSSASVSTTVVGIWNPSTDTMTNLTLPPGAQIGWVARTGDGSKVILADNVSSARVYIYDVATTSITATRQFEGYILGFAVNLSGTQIAIAETETGIGLYDAQLNFIGLVPAGGVHLLFSKDGRYLHGVGLPDHVPLITTVDTTTLSLVGVAPAFAVNPPYYELFPSYEIETPFAIDETGLIFGGSDHGLALDDATFYENLSTTIFMPAFDKVVTPDAGPLNASTPVTVEFQAFDALPDVWFGEQRGTNASLDGAGILHVTAPPSSTPGPVNVKILEPNGVQVFDPQAFSYGPTALFLSGSGGSPAGGATADIIGLGLPLDPAQAQVTVGGARATVLSAKKLGPTPGPIPYPTVDLQIRLPAGRPGKADFTVTTSAGSSTLPKAFEFAQSVTDYSSPDTFSAVMYDASRDQLYLSAQDHVDVFSAASKAFLSAIVPPSVNGTRVFGGMALTPDGSKLLVTNIGDGSVAVVDPDNPSVSTAVALAPPANSGGCPYGPLYIAATNTGKAFIQFGSPPAIGCGPVGDEIYELDLASLTVRHPASFQLLPNNVNTFCGASFVSASRDGSKVAFGGQGRPGFCVLNALDDSLYGTFFYWSWGVAAAGDGNVFASQWKVTDAQVNTLVPMALPDIFYPDSIQPPVLPSVSPLLIEKLNDSGSLLYVPFPNYVEIFDVKRGLPRLRITLTEQIRNAADALAIDPSGRRIFLITDRGLTIVELIHAPLSIGSVTPAAGPAGTQVTIRGSGFQQGVSVSFNDVPATTTLDDEDTLRVSVPVVPAGPMQFSVRNSDGQVYTLDNAFVVQ